MKKALLIGIGSYPPPADRLEAPREEVRIWKRRLKREYGFDEVTAPPENECDRPRVLREIRGLLHGARAGDEILFAFFGHGGDAAAWTSDTQFGTQKSHALMLYLEAAAANGFQSATITPSDIARILKDVRPTVDVRFTMLLVCCFAARFDGERGAVSETFFDPRPLMIRNAVPPLAGEPVTFSQIVGLVGDKTIATPLILAAAGETETEIEFGQPGSRRLLCSLCMSRRLEIAATQGKPVTNRELIDDINPLRSEQQAQIRGNATNVDELFVGGLAVSQPFVPAPPQADIESAVNNATSPAGSLARMSVSGPALTIRIIGLATFIDHFYKENQTRIVFPYDWYKPSGPEHHFGFIEVAEADLVNTDTSIAYRYLKAGVMYARWTLTEDRVTFGNVVASGAPVWRDALFRRHVPGLTVVSPELKDEPEPHNEIGYEFPTAGRHSAFLDFEAGAATIGELEKGDTEFRTKNLNVRTWGPEKTAICAIVTIPLSKDHCAIVMHARSGGRRVAYVRQGATIVIGNAREDDITGPGSGEGESAHFEVYYSAAPVTVYDPGLPYSSAIPINACTVTTYP